MPVHFCPECGTKLQPGFKFCPSCGEKLPSLTEPPEPTHTQRLGAPDAVCKLSTHVGLMSVAPVLTHDVTLQDSLCDLSSSSSSSSSALNRSPIKSTRRSSIRKTSTLSTPPKPAASKSDRSDPSRTEQMRLNQRLNQTLDLSPVTSPRKRKACLGAGREEEEEEQKKLTSPLPQTPPSGKGKRTKRVCAVEPVEEGLECCDQSGKKWRLVALLSQTDVELTYEVQQVGVRSSSHDSKHIMRLGAKEGQLFKEQNFLQRAAKPAAVEKWIKKLGLDFLGIPSCVGFGVYETYRFLIFPAMGCTLQSVLDAQTECLSERDVLQLALRLLDALEFIHENEYAHADLHAGNVYISTHGASQVFLSGFGNTFRFCPGGKHVEYREGGRTPHHGNLNFISVDSHKGAGPSRRSDLQSLGFCLLFWLSCTLPWSPVTQPGSAVCAQKERYMADIPALMSYCFKKKKVSGALQSYLSHVMSLQYTEKPNYSLLKRGLSEALQELGGTLGEPLSCRLEERDTFSSLDNSTVSVRKFQLNFHMDPELTTCQFYLTVHQIVSVGRVSRHPRPPSCTMLLSVRQQILKTWRSLMKENSVTSLASQSQSAFPLSCLMGAWHNDIIMDLLNDAIKKIGTHTEGHLRMATPTHWHQERLRCRDEPCFSTPVSHLLIPEEQREMLTADPGVSGSSQTLSGLVPPETIERPITVQDWGGDSLSVASDRPEDARQITLNNTRAEAWCVTGGGGGEGGGGERESPWDMFCPAADLLVTPSSASESSLESLSHMDSRSLLATGSSEESTVVVPPFQRLRPSPQSPAQPSDPTTTDLQEQPQTPPSPLTSSEHTAIMGVEEQSPIDAPQKPPHLHQVSPTPPTKKRHVHSDGSSFSYTYEPCPIIASALSRY
ncbi:inactive serine/threonine-protein kinase VRK3-like, partial [Clarias magur]